MHGYRGDPVAAEELGREIGVGDSDAERDATATALVAPDIEGVLGTPLRLDGLSQRRWVEPATAPGDRRIVDIIGDPEVAKRTQVATLGSAPRPSAPPAVLVVGWVPWPVVRVSHLRRWRSAASGDGSTQATHG